MSDAMKGNLIPTEFFEEDWIIALSITLQDDAKWVEIAAYWSSRTNLSEYSCDARCVLNFGFFHKFAAQ